MFVLICNSGDGESLQSTLKGVFETQQEAYEAMVELIGTHRSDWATEYGADEEAFTVKVSEDQGVLVDGDGYDWRYYEKYLIFDSGESKTFVY